MTQILFAGNGGVTQNGKTVVYPDAGVGERDPGCTFCALNASLSQALANYVGELVPGIVVMVTGSPARPDHLDRVLRAVEETPVQVFPILLPTAHQDLMKLGAAGGGVAYAVPEGEAALSPQVIIPSFHSKKFHHSKTIPMFYNNTHNFKTP